MEYASYCIYGNIGWNSYIVYSGQPAGDSGAEDLQKSKIWNIHMELNKKEGPCL